MSRRFPTPLVGVPNSRDEVRRVVELANSGSLDWEEYRARCRAKLRKPDTNERYSRAYIDRITSTFVTLGLVDRDDDVGVTVSPPGREWLADEQDFETFLWHALKRRWVLMGSFPEGVEALERIYQVLRDAAPASLSRSTIEDRLEADFGYEFNDDGIRGYPQLLALLGAVKDTEGGYRPTESEATFVRRFRETDVCRRLERRLKREGVNVSPPSDRVKRDLAKYYMYRESGGWNKRGTWYDTVWRDYLTPKARAGETADARFDVRDRYVEADNRRKDLRDAICTRFPAIDRRSLSGLSADVLRRMADAETVQAATRIQLASGSGMSRADLDLLDGDRPPYSFADGFTLYDWQQEAVDDWFAGSDDGSSSDAERGVAKVVTGAGKTVMALGVIERWLEENPDGVVTVVVPTRVLMRQWLTELRTKLQVPTDDLGWAGGGHKDSFADDRRIIVTVVNSAVKDDYLGTQLAAVGEPSHLLIADECHRYTGDTFSNVFSYPRTGSLGLSATPLSTTDDDRSADDELLLSELGPIYYELTYAEGLDRGLIPEFTVKYVGFELTEYERHPYEQFSRKISNAVSDIDARYGPRLDGLSGNYAQKLQVLLNESDGPAPAISDYFEFTQKRRELVANAVQRQAITYHLLDRAIDQEKKSIVFQERIEQLEQMIAPHETRGVNARTGDLADEASYRTELYRQDPSAKHYDQKLEQLFQRAAYKPVMYHSGHSRDVWNDFAMEWFRDGFANVMLSVKALVEGVDVPSADVGIVRVSNSSVRQRIQTLGRVLRTGVDESRRSELYVLYARDTVDERIFAEYDWDEQLANADVEHYVWEPAAVDGADDDRDLGRLREATTDEYPDPNVDRPEVPDAEDLDRGDPYPGPRDGHRVSVDANGDPFEKTSEGRRPIVTPAIVDAAAYVHEHKGGGKIYINEANHLVTVLEDGPVFLGTISGVDALEYGETNGSLVDDPVGLDELGFSQ